LRSTDPTEHQAKLDDAILFINKAMAAIKKVKKRPCVVVFVYQRTEALGYIGDSTVESFSTEPIIAQTVGEFKQMTQTKNSRIGSAQ
jgi:hypothetical protein